MEKIFSSFYSKDEKLDDIRFERLFKELYAALCHYAIKLVHRPEIAEEIVQEQFISLWEKRDMIIIHTSVKAYLFASVRNKSIDYLRSRYAKIRFEHEEVIYELKDPKDIFTIIENKELSELITKAINTLPEKCSIIFSLKRFGELTNKQIAEELNISEKTVENQISIAFKKLRPILVNVWC